MSAVNRAGIRTDALLVVGGGSVKPLPVIWDRIAYGSSLTIKDGTSGAPVTLEDIYAADSANGNQYGILRKSIGVYLGAGKLIFGKTDQTAITHFQDTNQVLVWQDFRQNAALYEIQIVGAGSYATTFQLGNYSGGLASGGCIIRGSGLGVRRAVAPVIVSGGTAYTVGDILTVSGGIFTAATACKVIAVSGGVITELKIETPGSYSVPPSGTLSLTGGTGNSATCTLTFVGGSIWVLTADAANQTTNLYGCILSEMKSGALTTTSAVRGCTFDNSGQITVGGATMTENVFQNLRATSPISASYQLSVTGSNVPTLTNNKFVNATVAVLWDINASTSGKLDGCSFISGGTGYGMELGTNCPAAITLTDVAWSGYGGTTGSNMVENSGSTDAAIHNTSGKTITISISGGDTPSIRNDGSGSLTEVVSSTTVTFTGMKDNTEVRVYKSSDGSVVDGIEDVTDGTSNNRSFSWSAAPSLSVDYVIHNVEYETIRVNGYVVPGAATSLPIQQRIDRNYENPP